MELVVVILVAFAQTTVAGLKRERDDGKAMDDSTIHIQVVQGQTAILPCTVDPKYTEQHKDRYQVVWVSPRGTAISIEDRRMINDMRISVERPYMRSWNLHIRNVSVTDAGTYLCQLNTEPIITKRIHLVVQVPPMLWDYTQPVEIQRMEGEQVELFCNATGIPAPVVTWWRANRWDSSEKEKVGQQGERLVIHNVTRMCADAYICIADNDVQPATKQEFVVEVNYAPEVLLHNQRIGQEVGKETILECIISSHPLHVTRWTHSDGTPVNNNHNYEVNVYEYSSEPNTIILSLRIVRVELSDYGDYICEASNNYGRASKTMTLYRVYPRTPPTTPTTTTTTTTTTAATPRWDRRTINPPEYHNPIYPYVSTTGARPFGQDGPVRYKGIIRPSNSAGRNDSLQIPLAVTLCLVAFWILWRLARF